MTNLAFITIKYETCSDWKAMSLLQQKKPYFLTQLPPPGYVAGVGRGCVSKLDFSFSIKTLMRLVMLTSLLMIRPEHLEPQALLLGQILV